ncbi:MAG: (d)CMP kinase [Christensenellaceae bacterium]|nr:(d)CMP kinase [Christensenellaceae bacterium]
MHIAIDGPSGAGKSTIAKALAQRLGLTYLDTGAMYRAVGLKALRLGLDLRDAAALEGMLKGTTLRVERGENGLDQRLFLDGEEISAAIRSSEVTWAATVVSTLLPVRAWLVSMQREIAKGQDIVMDGRDIGTKVLPDADFKFFLTADDAIRAARRHLELRQKGENIALETVLTELRRRDLQDSTRAESPLTLAKDATVVDSGDLSIDEVVELLLALMGKA